MVGEGSVPTMCFGFFFILSVVVSSASSDCPCETPSLCEPIKATPKKEIFIFSLTNSSDVWGKYNWSLVTTVVTVGYHNDDLMCLAHKHGARIVTIANYGPVDALANSTLRHMWTAKQVKTIQQYYLDRINFDFESAIPQDRKEYRDGYIALVHETSKALKGLNPSAQVTVDVAWSPANIDGRYYDYSGLASVSDFLFIMSYDERSQIFGPCVAAANSAYQTTYSGIKLYLQITDPSKLVLGLPWYGYDYPCVELYPNNTCKIPYRPFRDVQCSDAAGTQHNYDIIMTMLYKNSTTGRLWDDSAKSPYYNYKSAGDQKMHQVWYDDPESLTYKYKIVNSLNLRGAGMWQADTLNYTNSTEVQQMWGALSVIIN